LLSAGSKCRTTSQIIGSLLDSSRMAADEEIGPLGIFACAGTAAARSEPRIVTDKPTRKLYTPTPSSDERTTVPPPFDIEAFARETTAPDFTSSHSAEPPSQSRPKLADSVREGATECVRPAQRHPCFYGAG
jgi:hypothetical protein